jgi:hypothetical protein
LSSDGGRWRAGALSSFRADRQGSGASPLNEGFGRQRPMSGPDPQREGSVDGVTASRRRGPRPPSARLARHSASERFSADGGETSERTGYGPGVCNPA